MTTLHAVESATHSALLDVTNGLGILLAPPTRDDLASPFGGPSLHEAGWDDLIRRLQAMGWELLEDEAGDVPCLMGTTAQGGSAYSLYLEDCITTQPSLEELALSEAGLKLAGGVL